MPFFLYHKIEKVNKIGEIIKLEESIIVDNKHVNAIIKTNKTEHLCVPGMHSRIYNM